MRRLTDEILLQTKDGLRGLRYVIRHEARAPSLPLLPDLLRRAGLPGNPLARVADEVMSRAEAAARSFAGSGLVPERLAPPMLLRAASGFPLPAAGYLGAGDDGRRRFVAAHYRGYKAILAGCGADNVLVSETAIEAAHDGLLRATSAMPATPGAAAPAGSVAPSALPAAIAVALVRAGPVIRADGVRGLPDGCDANRFCALVAGLATAIVSQPEEPGAPAATVLASAADAVAVRYPRMRDALAVDDAEAALARVFAGLAPYLP